MPWFSITGGFEEVRPTVIIVDNTEIQNPTDEQLAENGWTERALDPVLNFPHHLATVGTN